VATGRAAEQLHALAGPVAGGVRARGAERSARHRRPRHRSAELTGALASGRRWAGPLRAQSAAVLAVVQRLHDAAAHYEAVEELLAAAVRP
jgi:hypothetical protein